MRFFFFFQILFGICLYVQSSDRLWKKNFWSLKFLVLLTLLYIFLIILVFVFFSSSLLFFSTVCHSPHLILSAVGKVLCFWKERQFRRQFLSFLSELLLQMRSGKSFRSSLKEMSRSQRRSGFFQKKMEDIINLVLFSKDIPISPHSNFISRLLFEFKKADEEPHNSLRRLSHFRTNLKIEENFKKQSGKILSYVRFQSLLLSFLYILLLVFSIWRYGYKSNFFLFFFSFLSFSLGVVLLFSIGRSIKWKV